ncbi:MAG: PQQ-binding-like beta-propeller repeat protein, partial [bacterium]
MYKILILVSIIAAASSCTSFRLQLPEKSSLPGWHSVGGDPKQNNFREEGPLPPLELIDTISMTAAPVQNLIAIDSTILISTKNGRIFSYRLNRGRGKGKLKLPEKIVGTIGLHESGLLIIGMAIGRETLFCYDLRNGELKWKQRAGLLFGEPVVADSSVYLVARFKHVDRYSIRNGKRLWRFDLESQAHTAPGLSRKYIVFGTDKGDIYALAKKSGAKIWQQKAGAAIFASPVIDDKRVYIGAQDSTVRAFRLNSGAPIWTFKAKARIRRTPALSGNILVVATGDGTVYGLDSENGTSL